MDDTAHKVTGKLASITESAGDAANESSEMLSDVWTNVNAHADL